jgi:hypothetical protein
MEKWFINIVSDVLQMEKRKASLALELLTTVVAHSDIGNEAMCTLAANLWGLVQRTSQTDTKAMVRCYIVTLLLVHVQWQWLW